MPGYVGSRVLPEAVFNERLRVAAGKESVWLAWIN
jgi:hypothetical protein